MKHIYLAVPFLAFAPAVQADVTAQELLDVMRFDEFIAIARAESLADNVDLPETFLEAQPSDTWSATLEAILNEADMLATVETTFLATLNPDSIAEIYDFVSSDVWQSAVTLENSAREAMLDDGIEEAAIAAYYEALDNDNQRLQDLQPLIDGANLIDSNVVGAFNSMFDFYQGLGAGGFELGLDEDQLFGLILDEEATIRADVVEWLNSFLLLAYDPLSDEALAAQTEFMITPAGQNLNNAMFEAFDALYTGISFDLGEALARAALEQTL